MKFFAILLCLQIFISVKLTGAKNLHRKIESDGKKSTSPSEKETNGGKGRYEYKAYNGFCRVNSDGTGVGNSNYYDLYYGDYVSCAKACWWNEKCKAFEYAFQTNRCEIWTVRPKGISSHKHEAKCVHKVFNYYPTTNHPFSSTTSHPNPKPTQKPTAKPVKPVAKTPYPTSSPSRKPSPYPTPQPSSLPTSIPTRKPSPHPTPDPTLKPSSSPTASPTRKPSPSPTREPSFSPSSHPTQKPSPHPTRYPTHKPSPHPTSNPTRKPSPHPTPYPTPKPSPAPTPYPTHKPSPHPTPYPTQKPSPAPTHKPTRKPMGQRPTPSPTVHPTKKPTPQPVATKPTQPPERSNDETCVEVHRNPLFGMGDCPMVIRKQNEYKLLQRVLHPMTTATMTTTTTTGHDGTYAKQNAVRKWRLYSIYYDQQDHSYAEEQDQEGNGGTTKNVHLKILIDFHHSDRKSMEYVLPTVNGSDIDWRAEGYSQNDYTTPIADDNYNDENDPNHADDDDASVYVRVHSENANDEDDYLHPLGKIYWLELVAYDCYAGII